MCPEPAHQTSKATPLSVEYRCWGCGHRQCRSATSCPRCGQALTEVPVARPIRFGMDDLPSGFEPLAVDPGDPTEGDDAISHGTPQRNRPGRPLEAVAPNEAPHEGPPGSATGPRGARTSKVYCPHCRATRAPLELFEGGQAELHCPACSSLLEARDSLPQELSFRNDKILVIDDDALIRQLVATTLNAHGFVPLTAPDGLTGVALAAAERPRLILVDIMMPGMDGFEVCRRLRADPRTAAIPLIILTALADPKLKVKAFQAGAALALAKPFDAKTLIATMQTALALKEGRPAP